MRAVSKRGFMIAFPVAAAIVVDGTPINIDGFIYSFQKAASCAEFFDY